MIISMRDRDRVEQKEREERKLVWEGEEKNQEFIKAQ